MTISVILDNFLYLGAAKDTKNEDEMNRFGISHVLSCAGTVISPEKYIIANEKFDDDEAIDISEQIEKAYLFIEHVRMKKGRVFVHCLAGKSRSASIVLSYLLKRNLHSLSDILFYVHSRRPEIRPNDGFMNQLLNMELKLRNKESLSRTFREWRSIQTISQKMKINIISANYTTAIATVVQFEEYILKSKEYTYTFFNIHLPKDYIKEEYKKQIVLLSSTEIDIQYFTKLIQQELSNTTLKATEFTKKNYFLDWQTITNLLQSYIQEIIKEINN